MNKKSEEQVKVAWSEMKKREKRNEKQQQGKGGKWQCHEKAEEIIANHHIGVI